MTFSKTLSNYLMNLSNSDTSIVKETHDSTTQTGSNATIDYRYIGANPNNYVCLESSGSCTDDQLYRIIGVIPTQSSDNGDYENRVKLIKHTNYGNYAWGTNNNWTTSTLNKTTLNTTYWNSISAYQKYIGDTKWYLGGHTTTATAERTTAKVYNAERGTTVYSGNSTSTIAKIGLMYASDYGYATGGGSTKNRSACLAYTLYSWSSRTYADCNSNDWMYLSSSFWTLSTLTTPSSYVYRYTPSYLTNTAASNSYGVRPVFNLKLYTAYKSGDGSKSNPYQIAIG